MCCHGADVEGKKCDHNVAKAWNAFVETGAAPKPKGLIDGSDDDTGTRHTDAAKPASPAEPARELDPARPKGLAT